MSVASVKDFYELVKSDQKLQEHVKNAEDKTRVVQIASHEGYEFTVSELEKAISEFFDEGDRELSLEELTAIAGGGGGYLEDEEKGHVG